MSTTNNILIDTLYNELQDKYNLLKNIKNKLDKSANRISLNQRIIINTKLTITETNSIIMQIRQYSDISSNLDSLINQVLNIIIKIEQIISTYNTNDKSNMFINSNNIYHNNNQDNNDISFSEEYAKILNQNTSSNQIRATLLSKLKNDVNDTVELFEDVLMMTNQTGEILTTIEDETNKMRMQVNETRREVRKAARKHRYSFGLIGGAIGACVIGPIGFLIGIKAVVILATSGAILGIITAKQFSKFLAEKNANVDTITKVNKSILSNHEIEGIERIPNLPPRTPIHVENKIINELNSTNSINEKDDNNNSDNDSSNSIISKASNWFSNLYNYIPDEFASKQAKRNQLHNRKINFKPTSSVRLNQINVNTRYHINDNLLNEKSENTSLWEQFKLAVKSADINNSGLYSQDNITVNRYGRI